MSERACSGPATPRSTLAPKLFGYVKGKAAAALPFPSLAAFRDAALKLAKKIYRTTHSTQRAGLGLCLTGKKHSGRSSECQRPAIIRITTDEST